MIRADKDFLYAQQCPKCDEYLEIQQRIYGIRYYSFRANGSVQEEEDYIDDESTEVRIICPGCGFVYAEGVEIYKAFNTSRLAYGTIYEE